MESRVSPRNNSILRRTFFPKSSFREGILDSATDFFVEKLKQVGNPAISLGKKSRYIRIGSERGRSPRCRCVRGAGRDIDGSDSRILHRIPRRTLLVAGYRH